MIKQNFLFVQILFLVTILGSCASQQIRNSDLPGKVYRVRKGDNLSYLSKEHGISMREIMEINGLSDPSHVSAGQFLFLPETNEYVPKPQKKPKVRVVKKAKTSRKIKQNRVYKKSKARKNLNWPVKKGKVFQRFDETPEYLFEGIALKASAGTDVYTAAPGQVIYVAKNVNRFGRMVIIKHNKNFVTIYAHLSKILVAKGKRVKSGEIIGKVGKSGGVEFPRLYFQVRKDRMPVDPERYLK